MVRSRALEVVEVLERGWLLRSGWSWVGLGGVGLIGVGWHGL